MVTIEPIMKFDLNKLLKLIIMIRPDYINIGADTQNKNLLEPTSCEVKSLIIDLRSIAKVNVKPNLKRILEGDEK